jgi:hypothetical protein
MHKRRSLTGIRLRHRSQAHLPCKGSACRMLPPRFPCRPRPPLLPHNLVPHHSMGAMRRIRRLPLQRQQCTRCVHRRNHRSQATAQSPNSSMSPWLGYSQRPSKACGPLRVDNTHTRQVLLIKSVSQSWLVYERRRQHSIRLRACYDMLPEACCKPRPLTCSYLTDLSELCTPFLLIQFDMQRYHLPSILCWRQQENLWLRVLHSAVAVYWCLLWSFQHVYWCLFFNFLVSYPRLWPCRCSVQSITTRYFFHPAFL